MEAAVGPVEARTGSVAADLDELRVEEVKASASESISRHKNQRQKHQWDSNSRWWVRSAAVIVEVVEVGRSSRSQKSSGRSHGKLAGASSTGRKSNFQRSISGQELHGRTVGVGSKTNSGGEQEHQYKQR